MLVASERSPRLMRTRIPVVRPVTIPPAQDVATMAFISTAWGQCALVWKTHENESSPSPFAVPPANPLLCRILIPGESAAHMRRLILRGYPSCREVLGDRHGQFHPEIVPEWFGQLLRYLQAYYSNGLRDWTVPQFQDNWAFWKPRLNWSVLTPFQKRVLEATAEIGCGMHMTYGQIAARIGKPHASRAVGAALGANPWPVLVPCHRVVGSQGKLTGFSAPGGVVTKRRMLELENAPGLFD